MYWIGPPLVTNADCCDKTKTSLQQLEKKQEEELAAIRNFKPEIDVIYGFDEDIEKDDDTNIIAEGSDDEVSTQQADDDEDLGFIDTDGESI